MAGISKILISGNFMLSFSNLLRVSEGILVPGTPAEIAENLRTHQTALSSNSLRDGFQWGVPHSACALKLERAVNRQPGFRPDDS